MPCHVRIFWENAPWIFGKKKIEEIYARPLPRVYAIFLFAIEYSAKAQHTTTTTTTTTTTGGYTPLFNFIFTTTTTTTTSTT